MVKVKKTKKRVIYSVFHVLLSYPQEIVWCTGEANEQNIQSIY